MKSMRKRAESLAVALLLGGALFAGGVFADDKVNINTASEQELMKLPEMTEVRAKAIVRYRQTNGEFIQAGELELIPQVKPIYDKIKDKVTVE